MCIIYLGFVLVVWFPAGLRAQSVTQSCSAPSLDHGFFAPKQEIYSHGTKLTYTCNDGYKPAEKSWWVTSTCENGKWSHQPQCIDEHACIPPNIVNGKYTEMQTSWYKGGTTIRITCDKGYEPKNQAVTARCVNGTWSSLPICEKSTDACSEPPKIQHAVIIRQEPQEVFAADSVVHYECRDGYTAEGGDTNITIVCVSGKWTDAAKCTSTTSSGSSEVAEVQLRRVAINNCGAPPRVENGDVVQTQSMFLKYQCIDFYSLEGSDRVACYSNGQWSDVPTCRATYCSLDTDADRRFESVGVQFLRDGEEVTLECKKKRWTPNKWSMVRCTDTTLTFSDCCLWASIKVGNCITQE
ncbi:complement factor H-like [Anabas testudineus]|uniref:Sushi domain-containing protein n=1 Tax=Anabas testudineus TaxID=64144 RepID=A0A3Q1J6S3_ANATE|nr:complement factor H-like [Anabas testudineus]